MNQDATSGPTAIAPAATALDQPTQLPASAAIASSDAGVSPLAAQASQRSLG
eukprot:CAMPEP_0196733044 /NCGR_PEP_ID=MMETSP1091-20130531/12262_1 /TAXON_ID=302021 /ORGANISM="Rhodomonas sp., Strain CCMP768" /LENGTH=51 /DNA_ID=CAMNT_0042076389 /DNA_START=17 /DNA_END=169 /DNA_ORIENTATION=+